MAQYPTMPLFTDAYIADTRDLSCEEHGAYLQLLIFMWRSPDGWLPDDDTKLARMVGLTPAKWRRVKAGINRFFITENEQISQKKLQKTLKNLTEKLAKNKQNGKLGGEAKSLKNNITHLANATKTLEQNGWRNSSEPPSEKLPYQNQKKEKNIKKRKIALPEACPERVDQEKALAFWQQKKKAINLRDEVMKFRSHHTEKGTTGLSWPDTWRTWYVNAAGYCQKAGRPVGAPFDVTTQEIAPIVQQGGYQTVADRRQAYWAAIIPFVEEEGRLPRHCEATFESDCPDEFKKKITVLIKQRPPAKEA